MGLSNDTTHAILGKLEPESAGVYREINIDDAAMMSFAISMKRAADALEKIVANTTDLGDAGDAIAEGLVKIRLAIHETGPA